MNIFTLPPTQLNSLLSNPAYDLSDCLANCSSQGMCFLNALGQFLCVCNVNYTGSKCEIDKRFCAYQGCANGGRCVDIGDSTIGNYTNFTCVCPYPFYGRHCETTLDLCKDETCSDHGYCMVVNVTNTLCKCYYMYEGVHCELITERLQVIRRVITTSTILAIIIIILFYATIVTLDLMSFFMNKGKLPKKKPEKYRFVYHNKKPNK